jgi:hypothetical protein
LSSRRRTGQSPAVGAEPPNFAEPTGLDHQGAPSTLDAMVMLSIVFLLPIRALTPLGSVSLDAGILISLMLLPVLLFNLPRAGIRWTWLVALMAVAFLAAPLWSLLAIAEDPGRSLESDLQRGTMLILLAGIVTLLVFAWGVQRVPVQHVITAYALGLITNAVLSGALASANPWKTDLGWPCAVLIVILAMRFGQTLAPILGLLLVATISIALDSRSMAAFALASCAALYWTRFRRPRKATFTRIAGVTLGLSAIVIGCYVAGVIAVESGALGASIQHRSLAQSESASFLLSARPESAAAFALFSAQPLGYGPGLVPSVSDTDTARLGLYTVDSRLNNSAYVDDYLLGDKLELHSVTGDLWLAFGIPGLLIAGILLFILLRGVASAVIEQRMAPLMVFIGISAIWDVFFSPIYSNLGLVLVATLLSLTLFKPDRFDQEPSPSEGTAR